MLRKTLLLTLCVPLCTGVACQVSLPGGSIGIGSPYVQLDQATAAITVSTTTTGTTATALASIQHNGEMVVLQSGQAVSVNGVAMTGPNVNLQYSLSVAKAVAYTVRVDEPTLGSKTTSINAPADFQITAPGAGASVSLLNGFPLAWSNPDPLLTYTVTMSQTQTDGSQRVVVLGPSADSTGGVVVTHDNIKDFRQGANLSIKVTKTAQVSDVAGFAAGSTLKVELTQTISVAPAP